MRLKTIAISLIALAVSIVPPLLTTLHYFPVWTDRSAAATVSGVVVFLGILCFVPLYKKILSSLRSPSAPVMWAILATVMFVMKDISDEMFVIAVVGTISNLIGWFIFKQKRKRQDLNRG